MDSYLWTLTGIAILGLVIAAIGIWAGVTQNDL
jgi:hypothetical protein